MAQLQHDWQVKQLGFQDGWALRLDLCRNLGAELRHGQSPGFGALKTHSAHLTFKHDQHFTITHAVLLALLSYHHISLVRVKARQQTPIRAKLPQANAASGQCQCLKWDQALCMCF